MVVMKKSTLMAGFTIIEVMLALAVSGLVLAGMLLSIRGSIDQQRYSDSVDDFKDFLQKQYDDIDNMPVDLRDSALLSGQCKGNRGQSKCLILGRILKISLDSEGESRVEVWPVIANEDSLNNNIEGLSGETPALNDQDLFTERAVKIGLKVVSDSSITTYKPAWGAQLYRHNGTRASEVIGRSAVPATDAFFVLLIRSPLSNSILTYAVSGEWGLADAAGLFNESDGLIKTAVAAGQDRMNFCIIPAGVNPTAPGYTSNNRAVTLFLTGAATSSAVEVAPLDTDVNQGGTATTAVRC